jgi:hypothetical protein
MASHYAPNALVFVRQRREGKAVYFRVGVVHTYLPLANVAADANVELKCEELHFPVKFACAK